MKNAPFLEAVAVSLNYSKNKDAGVNNVTLSVEQGKITAIVGESGSGKSTLLKLFFGLLSPQKGKIFFCDKEVQGPETKLIPGHDAMKMVTQHADDLNLFATVFENIAAQLPNTDLIYKEQETRRVLNQLNIYAIKDHKVSSLSGGEKQRVAIARALITRPQVILLDEPFNQVDAYFREGLQQTIRQVVRDTGVTVLMVSHDPSEVLTMADVLIVLRQGEIVEMGSPRQLFHSPKMLYTAQILSHCSILSGHEAQLCGINAQRAAIAINPEHIEIVKNLVKNDWLVHRVLFKGFYEELIIAKDEVFLRVLNLDNGRYAEGSRISIRINKYFEFGAWR